MSWLSTNPGCCSVPSIRSGISAPRSSHICASISHQVKAVSAGWRCRGLSTRIAVCLVLRLRTISPLTPDSSAPSGGTLATVLNIFESFSFKEVADSHKPYALSPISNPKSPPKASIQSILTGAYYVPNLGLQSTSLTAGTDMAVVQRTWGLLQQVPALQKRAYGSNFTVREYRKTRNVVTAMAMHYSLLIGGALLAFCPPFRSLLRRFIFQPGEGPSREDSAKDYVEYRGVATPDVQPASGKQALCRAWFHGSMYLRKCF